MRRVLATLAIFLCASAVPGSVHALYRTNKVGDIDLGGRVRSTNIFRHSDIDRWAFIMQRNELKLRFEWKWLQRGKAFGKYQVPWLERSDLFVVYRGIYDSVYDTTPGQIETKDLQGDPISRSKRSLNPDDKGAFDPWTDDVRDEVKFNNRIREAYIDLYFKQLPLTLRLGKQQIVWGESDGFRMLDRANTLDLSWHFFQELPPPGFGFDELRNPFWMVKGLWDFKQLGPLSQPFLEFYWNPGDWIPGEISFLPRPWGVRLLDPIRDPQNGAFFSGFCNDSDSGHCEQLLNGTELFKQGDYNRNPLDNSQFGLRFHFITPQGVEMTLNYLYQRFSPDGSAVAIVRGLPQDGTTFVSDSNGIIPGNQPAEIPNERYCSGLDDDPGSIANPWGQRALCLEYFAPYVHTVGFSLNWFEGDYTQTVWRVETIIDFDLPFYDGDRQTALFGRSPNGSVLVPGIAHRNMWKGMLAFDRPTWIKWLNKQTTFFVTGQFFWHYIINHERRRCAINDQARFLADAQGEIIRDENGDPVRNPDFVGYTSSPLAEQCGSDTAFLLPGEQTGFVGPLDLPKLTAPGSAGRDTIHQWELLSTLAVLGFYKGGSLVPALIYILDPVNAYSQEIAFGVDWFITPDVAINFTTRLIWAGLPWDAYDGHKTDDDPDLGEIFDPWFLAGGSRGRSESGLMFTWQF
jgi:hypothetical protein